MEYTGKTQGILIWLECGHPEVLWTVKTGPILVLPPDGNKRYMYDKANIEILKVDVLNQKCTEFNAEQQFATWLVQIITYIQQLEVCIVSEYQEFLGRRRVLKHLCLDLEYKMI